MIKIILPIILCDYINRYLVILAYSFKAERAWTLVYGIVGTHNMSLEHNNDLQQNFITRLTEILCLTYYY
jgi:hypothetical protein